jgi:hypothetical protein
MPTLESCGYDEALFQQKSAEFHKAGSKADIQAEFAKRDSAAGKQREQAQRQKKADAYSAKTGDFVVKNPDFVESVSKMPLQNTGAATALLDAGPDVTYHLSKNLDIVDQLNGMSEIEAAVEVGRISERLKVNNKKLKTDAPEPITPIKGGGTMNTSLPGEELIRGAKFY